MPGFEVGDHHLWVGTNLFWETSQKLMEEQHHPKRINHPTSTKLCIDASFQQNKAFHTDFGIMGMGGGGVQNCQKNTDVINERSLSDRKSRYFKEISNPQKSV